MEAGARWTARLIKSLRARNAARLDRWLSEQVFVSCAIDDVLPYVIGKAGDGFLVSATDFRTAMPSVKTNLPTA